MILTEFLLARFAEVEAAARAATVGPWGHDPSKEWHSDPVMLARARAGKLTYDGEEFVRTDSGTCVAATGPADDPQSMRDADHIARHNPARVLADIEAKRRIVERYVDTTYIEATPSSAYDLALFHVMCDLALPYADHPDYDADEWKP